MDLRGYIDAVEKQKLNVEGVIVMQGGKKIACHRWIPETPRNVFSVSKSFTSIAAGMAVDDGKLRLGDRVIDAFPRQGAGARLASLTLEHLLTMTKGYREFCRPDSVDEALSQELCRDPGSAFLYDNACTFLVSAMITKATGLKVRDMLIERLFRPLGIPDPVWPESTDGYTVGATALELTTSSLAVFGQFLLRRGNWEGRQLVSAPWIDGATRTQVPTRNVSDTPDADIGYGYQFWTCRHGAYRADGKDGQFVVVLPGLEAVIAVNSNEEKPMPILWALWDHILPRL